MKKRLVILLLACSMAVTAIGCSNKDKKETETTASSNADNGETITVKLADGTVKLGKYKGIELAKVDTAVSDQMLESSIKDDLMQQGIEVTDSPAQLGDTVTIDFVGSIDGENFEGGEAKDYDLQLGSGSFIPGFEDQVVGMAIDEVKDISVTFPENYAEELAGKDAVFNITLHKIKRAPELSDEVVQQISDFKTVDEYKADKREKLAKNLEASALQSQQQAAWSQVVMNSSVEDISDSALEKQAAAVKEEIEKAATQYQMEYLDYMKQYFEADTEEKAAEKCKEFAADRLNELLLVQAIVQEEKLELTDAEYEEVCADLITDMGVADKASLEEEYGVDNIKVYAQQMKVIKFIIENAVQTESETTVPKTDVKETADGETTAEESESKESEITESKSDETTETESQKETVEDSAQ
jgi:trigger factor